MDAGGWALSARPAPGAGQRTRRVWEEVGPTLSPRAGAPGEPPRRGRGRRRAAAGPGLGAGDARRPREAQTVPGATAWGLGVGSYDDSAGAPHSTKGAAASASLPRDNAARNLAQGQPVWGASGHCHYQNKAWGGRRAPGFQIQTSEGIQALHISERQDSEKSQVLF